MSRVFRESNHESQRQARIACAAGTPYRFSLGLSLETGRFPCKP